MPFPIFVCLPIKGGRAQARRMKGCGIISNTVDHHTIDTVPGHSFSANLVSDRLYV